MTLTKRFGLHKFGASVGGDVGDDAYAFSTRDRDVEDSLFAAFEGHSHAGGVRLVDPVGVAVLTQAATGGDIPAGTTYYYRVSFIDAFGLETAASNEVDITTLAAILDPAPPTVLAVAGGTLEAGTYYYAITYLQGGLETLASQVSTLSVEGSTGSVQLDFPALPSGATGWRVYRKGPSDGDLYFLIDRSGSTTYVDTGAVVPGTATVPFENATNSTNKVTVVTPNVSVVGANPSAVKAWRIYRTTVSADYGGMSLVHEVVETVNQDGTGGLLTTWIDTGDSLLDGIPLSISTTLLPSAALAGPPGPGVATGGTVGQVLTKTASGNYLTGWAAPAGPTGAAGGDLTGTYPNPTITGLAPAKIAGTAVITTDSRLSDSRTPTAHAASHAPAASDDLTAALSAAAVPVALAAAAAAGVGTGFSRQGHVHPSTGLVLTGDAALTNPRTPSGPAGGDLGGNYPNPTLSDMAVSGLVTDPVSSTHTALSAAYVARVTGLTTDGTGDNTTLLQAAIDATSVAGGGEVLLPRGTIRANVVLPAKVVLVGEGVSKTTLKAVAGSNAPAVTGLNFATLTDKAYAVGDIMLGCYEAGLRGMTVDGDKATQSSGWVVRLWGRGLTLQDVNIQNGKEGGLWTEFTTHDAGASDDLLEGHFSNLKPNNNDGDGWRFRGPHDSYIENLNPVSNTGWGFYGETIYSSCYGVGWNGWLNGTGVFHFDSSFRVLNGAATANAVGVGLDVGANVGGGYFQGVIAGCVTGAVIRGSQITVDAVFSNNSGAAVQMGVTAGATAGNCTIRMQGFSNGTALNVQNVAQPCIYEGRIGCNTLFSGVYGSATDYFNLAQIGGAGALKLEFPGATVGVRGWRPLWPQSNGIMLTKDGSATTVGAAGGASALPATPTAYWTVKDENGASFKVPVYDS